MAILTEDLEDPVKYRQMLVLPYSYLIQFIFKYLKKRSELTFFYWALCMIFLGTGIIMGISIAGNFPPSHIIIHSSLGLIVFPIICIPVHEILHVIPYYISGAKQIRVGMELKQYLFYVTAHRHVTSPIQFIIVAIIPFFIISIILILLIFLLPGLWKWSLSLFLFIHTTMCAGDFALLNFYYMNKDKKIFTCDDADKKIAYFYEKL